MATKQKKIRVCRVIFISHVNTKKRNVSSCIFTLRHIFTDKKRWHKTNTSLSISLFITRKLDSLRIHSMSKLCVGGRKKYNFQRVFMLFLHHFIIIIIKRNVKFVVCNREFLLQAASSKKKEEWSEIYLLLLFSDYCIFSFVSLFIAYNIRKLFFLKCKCILYIFCTLFQAFAKSTQYKSIISSGKLFYI